MGGVLVPLASLSLVGCSDYDNGFTEKQIAFQQAFREQFGDIDPNHTWSTVTRSTLTVGVDMPGFDDPYTVRVYTANPRGKVSSCYLLGQWEADSPAPHDYVFDMPAGLKSVWVAVTKQNGGRYVQQARIVDHKCTANFSLTSLAKANTRAATEPTGDDDWKYFPLKYYKNDEGTGFIQIYPENDVDYESGICTDFEIVATGTDDIRLTHFYSNTSSACPVSYFIYNPKEQTVQQAFNNKTNHHVLCDAASNHIEHYSNDGWDTNGTGIDEGINGGWIINAPEGEVGADYAMRGRTVTIPKEDLQAGDHIVFYLTYTDGQGDHIAATRATLNANNTAFAGLLNFGTLTYLGFEDSLGKDEPDESYDLNDVVYVLEGEGESFTVEDYEDELSRDMSYIVAYEDLGASEDFDFNDIVLKVSRVSGTQKVNISVLAAGGTLPVSIYHTRNGRTELFTDVHKLFGVETETVINAYPGRHTEYTPIRKSIELESGTDLNFSNLSIHVTQKDGQTYYGIHAPQYYDIPASDDTYIGAEDEVKNPLNVPYAILIADPTWDWPDENQNITEKYPKFKDWVKSADRTNWYESIWNGVDDEEPELPSGKMPTSRGNYGTYSPGNWDGSSNDQEVELIYGASLTITCYDNDCGIDDWTISPEERDETTGSTVTKDGATVTVTAGEKTGSFELTLTAPQKDKDETTYYKEETIKIKVSVVKPNFGDEISKDDMTVDEQGTTYHTNTYTIPASVFESYNAENYVTLTLVLTINEWNYWGQLQYKINNVVYSTGFTGSSSNIHEIELAGDDFVNAKESGLSIICTEGMTVDAVYIKAGSSSTKQRNSTR